MFSLQLQIDIWYNFVTFNKLVTCLGVCQIVMIVMDDLKNIRILQHVFIKTLPQSQQHFLLSLLLLYLIFA